MSHFRIVHKVRIGQKDDAVAILKTILVSRPVVLFYFAMKLSVGRGCSCGHDVHSEMGGTVT